MTPTSPAVSLSFSSCIVSCPFSPFSFFVLEYWSLGLFSFSFSFVFFFCVCFVLSNTRPDPFYRVSPVVAVGNCEL
jgi:uncharacterized BrkB/YihY/UPF0761 family membrane protein